MVFPCLIQRMSYSQQKTEVNVTSARKIELSSTTTTTATTTTPQTEPQQKSPTTEVPPRSIPTNCQLPLMTPKFVDARKPTKSETEDEKLRKKYKAIQDDSERAFQILLDLGMIEKTGGQVEEDMVLPGEDEEPFQ